jgi:tight adherence protein B
MDAILIIQSVIVVILLFILLFLYRFNRAIKLEKRIDKYSIESIKTETTSIFDNIYALYNHIQKQLTKLLLSIKIFDKYSLRYRKYIDFFDKDSKIAMDYVSNKVLVSVSFVLIKLFADIIEYRVTAMHEILLIGLLGFIIPDLFLMYNNYLRKKKIEKDLLNAIIIMNNAFKSGRSTMQAIEIVKNELEGPIQEEFKKMHLEITYGLSLEVVFKRFSERVNLEEVNYITSSLTILNKTGGNIVKVFSSIEKSLFGKKKLELELKSLTSSSETMIKSLLLLPFIFTGIILLLNPNYFNPLIEHEIGVIVLTIIVFFYVMYAYFVKKIMRVRL